MHLPLKICSNLRNFIKSYNSENSITFDDWIKNSVNPTDKDFLVQMDIEGSEYEVINSISNFNFRKNKNHGN